MSSILPRVLSQWASEVPGEGETVLVRRAKPATYRKYVLSSSVKLINVLQVWVPVLDFRLLKFQLLFPFGFSLSLFSS